MSIPLKCSGVLCVLAIMHRSPYSSSHIFEIECNNNWDDMEMIDCMDLKTPVFD